MSVEWYRGINGEKSGPYSAEQLKGLADAGHLQPDDLVWREGLKDWTAARKVKGLFADQPPPLPTAHQPSPLPTTELPDPFAFFADVPTTGVRSASRSSFSSPAEDGVHGSRIVIWIIAAIGALSTFLPWINVPIAGSINGTFAAKGEIANGWITLAAFVACGMLGSSGNKSRPVPRGASFLVTISGVGIVAFGIWMIVRFHQGMQRLSEEENGWANLFAGTTSIGVGLGLIVLAGFALILVEPVMAAGRRQSSGESIFASGFFGTFGVLAALIAPCVGCIAVVNNMRDRDEQIQNLDEDGSDEPEIRDVLVTLTRLEIGRPQLKEMFGGDTEAADEQLIVGFNVRNISERRIVRFTEDMFLNDAFTLVDDAGNTIRRVSYGASTVVSAMDGSDDLNPGDQTTHVEVFAVPPPGTEYLLLTIHLDAFSSSGDVGYRIEASDIRGFLPE